jgi:WD40 repeat protein
LPVELALHVLKYLDVEALGRLEQVSSKHFELSRSQASVWRTLFWQQPGWAVDLDFSEIRSKLSVSLDSLAVLGTPIASTTDDLAYGTLPRQFRIPRSSEQGDGSRSERVIDQRQQSSSSSTEDTSNPASFSMDPDTSFLPLELSLEQPQAHLNVVNEDSFSMAYQPERRSGEGDLMSLDDQGSYQGDARGDQQNDHQKKTIDWRRLYRSRLHLERNWRNQSYTQSEFQGHSEAIYCLQFDADKIMTGSRDDTVKIWDLKTKACIQSLRGHDASVLCLQYDSEFLVTGSSDSTIIVWSLLTGTLQRRLWGHSESVLGLRFTRKRIVSCSKDTTIKVWDFGSGDLLQTLVGHRAAVNAVQCHGNLIVSASGDRSIKIWNMETGQLLRTILGHSRGIACIQFNGSLIVSGSSDQTIRIWYDFQRADLAISCQAKRALLGLKGLSHLLYFVETPRPLRVLYKSLALKRFS